MARMNYQRRRKLNLVQLTNRQRRDDRSYAAELKASVRKLKRDIDGARARNFEARVRDLEARERDYQARLRDLEDRERKVSRFMFENKLGAYASR